MSVPWQNKRKGLEMDVSIAFKSDKIRRNLLQSTVSLLMFEMDEFKSDKGWTNLLPITV